MSRGVCVFFGEAVGGDTLGREQSSRSKLLCNATASQMIRNQNVRRSLATDQLLIVIMTMVVV